MRKENKTAKNGFFATLARWGKRAFFGASRELTEEEIAGVIAKEVKMRKDSIEEFKKGNRADLVEQAEQEVAVLMPYLPQQMSEEEVRQVVADTIAEVGAASVKEMGKVMSALMPKVKGRADGKLVNTIVRELLQK